MIKPSYPYDHDHHTPLNVAHGAFLLDRDTDLKGHDQIWHRELALFVDVGGLDAVLIYVSQLSTYMFKYVNIQHGDLFYQGCI